MYNTAHFVYVRDTYSQQICWSLDIDMVSTSTYVMILTSVIFDLNVSNRSQYILVAQKPQWVTLCLSPASDVNGPLKKQYQKQWKSVLHLAITCRKRTYIIEFGTLDNCKIILTQHICSAECIPTFLCAPHIRFQL